jgi:hypothetical protein
VASPATFVVLLSARQIEYSTGLTVIPVCFANVLEIKLADAPVSNKMLALAAAALPEKHHTCAFLLLSIRTSFCYSTPKKLICKHSCPTLSDKLSHYKHLRMLSFQILFQKF